MKALLLILVSLALAPTATAQSTRWTSPEGILTLTIPEGWEYGTGDLTYGVILSTARIGTTRDIRDTVLCTALRFDIESVEGFVDEALARLGRADPLGQRKLMAPVTDRVVNGIHVIGSEIVGKGPYPDGSADMLGMARQFAIERGGQRYMFLVSCPSRPNKTPAALAETRQFLDSIEINPQ